eukprot:TRINITY_DN2017_c2_g1_i1.p1 TRINITY_DN2017_c2_g1~~TRINITY_DN2017_c2_g1_i1.p1  ORF type:complete len:225 (-),score=37.02 TRINITY_DN2017_c2_g1_i1:599-1273(-)
MGEQDLDRASAPVNDSSSTATPPPPCKSVHRALGGGQVADVLLWKRRDVGIYLFMVSSTLWFLFERAGYSLITLVANVLLLLVVILFFWAKSASLLNRPLPPLPDLEVSEDFVIKTADAAQVWINYVLAIANDIALGRDVKLFVQVASGLLLVSLMGNLFNFFTLVYIGVVLSLTVPTLYDKYQDQIDDKLCVAHKVLSTWFRKFDAVVLGKIPLSLNKEKKTQ